MFDLSKLTDNATLIMGHMAQAPEALHTPKAIADRTHLPETTVKQILKKLTTSGLLRTKKGSYCFNKTLPQISVANIIDALNESKTIKNKLHPSKAQMIVYSKLQNLTLAELIRPEARRTTTTIDTTTSAPRVNGVKRKSH